MKKGKKKEKVNFTAPRVADFQCEPFKQQTIYWDLKTPGLGLRVTATGAKSYIFETRLHGKTLRITIGDERTWVVGKAQERVTELKALTDKGIDPRKVQEEQIAAEEMKVAELKQRQVVESTLVSEAWKDYIAERSAAVRDGKPEWGEIHKMAHLDNTNPGGEKRKSGRRAGQPELTSPGTLAPLMNMRMIDLTSQAVCAWIEKEVSQRATQAALAYRLLRAFINWCAKSDKYKAATNADACKTDEVKRKVPSVKVKKNDSVRRAQIRPWFEAIRKINSPIISAYLQILLLTGARRNELATLRWEDLDFKWKSMTIRDKATKGVRTIPLTPFVESLLLDLRRRNETSPVVELDYYINPKRAQIRAEKIAAWKPSSWVFSSRTSASGRLEAPDNLYMDTLKHADLPHVSLHGLRRSFGTLSEWVEVPYGIAAQIEGRKPQTVREKHYIQRELDLLFIWHAKIEAWILNEAGIKFEPVQSGLSIVLNNVA